MKLLLIILALVVVGVLFYYFVPIVKSPLYNTPPGEEPVGLPKYVSLHQYNKTKNIVF